MIIPVLKKMYNRIKELNTMHKINSRRLFLQKCVSAGMLLTGGALLLPGCNAKEKSSAKEEGGGAPPDPCSDYTGLSENDLKARESMGYVKQSPIPEKQCGNCNLWLPPLEGKDCGACQLFKGPVYTAGHCTYWAPQV